MIIFTDQEKEALKWALEQKGSMFPEQFFAPCRDTQGNRFRLYGNTIEEIDKKVKKSGALKGFKVYSAILKGRIR